MEEESTPRLVEGHHASSPDIVAAHLFPLPPDTDMGVYDTPTRKPTTPYTPHFPFDHHLNLPLAHYSHRQLALSDMFAMRVMHAYLFPSRKTEELLCRRLPPIPPAHRYPSHKFSTHLRLENTDAWLCENLDALNRLLVTEPDTDATPMMEYQGSLWPRVEAHKDYMYTPPLVQGRPLDDTQGRLRVWEWWSLEIDQHKRGFQSHRRMYSSSHRLTTGDRMLDLLQRYFLEVADAETRVWFERNWEVAARLYHGREPDQYTGLSRDRWWDNISRAAGVLVAARAPSRFWHRISWIHDTLEPARKAQQDNFVFPGFTSESEPISDPDAVVAYLRSTPWGTLTSLEWSHFICHGFQLWENRKNTRAHALAARFERLEEHMRALPSRPVPRLVSGRWARPPRGRRRDALRTVVTPSGHDEGGERGRPRIRGRSAPVHGEWTSTLMNDYAGPVENLFYQPLRLSEMDRRCRRRSLSRRNILDMFHPTPASALYTDYFHPPSAAHIAAQECQQRTEEAEFATPWDNYKHHKPMCGHCGQRSHKTVKCPHPTKSRCKCRPFPQHHLAVSCPVLCSRRCGSSFIPGHEHHPNAMMCKYRCCMCGMHNHTGRECRLKKCRCGGQHLGQDCGWNPVCGVLREPGERKPYTPYRAKMPTHCELYLCGIHCRECGSREKPFVGFRCASCLESDRPARLQQKDGDKDKESVFGDFEDDVMVHRTKQDSAGAAMFRSLAFLYKPAIPTPWAMLRYLKNPSVLSALYRGLGPDSPGVST